jgi:hypothetical protein
MFLNFRKKTRSFFRDFERKVDCYLGQQMPGNTDMKLELKLIYFRKICKITSDATKCHFKALCISYFFFLKFCGHKFPYVINFNKFFLKLGKNI